MAEDLRSKTAKGLVWGLLNNGTMQVLNLLFGIVLGRLLSPEEYGVVGVLAIFTALAGDLQSAGFSQALVNIKEPKDNDYNAVFWFNVLTSIMLYAILFLCAPLIAQFFHDPRLVGVSRLVFLSFFISSLGIAHSAYLWKNLMVKENTIAGFVSLVCSGAVGVTLAVLGYSYWSLAWQQIVYISVLNIMRLRYSRWRPSLTLDFAPIRQMFPFAVKLLVTKLLTTLSQNILTVIIGERFSKSAVGNFTQANKWNTMGHNTISGAVQQVAQPVLASVSDDDDRERRVFSKMLRFTSFISFPALLGLALVGRELILATVGEKWLDSVQLLQILCIGGAFMPIYNVYQNLMLSRGRSDIYMWCNSALLLLQIAVVVACVGRGIVAMVAAYTLLNILFVAVWQWFAKRICGIDWHQSARDVTPFLAVAVMAMWATWFATRGITNVYVLLIVKTALAGTLYLASMKILNAKILDECLQFLRKKKQ